MSDANEEPAEITPGKYYGRCLGPDEVQFGYRTDGTEEVAIGFVITQGPCTGRRRGWYGAFTETGTEFVVKTLRACGWEGNDLNNLGKLDREVQLVFAAETWEGKTRIKLKYVNPIRITVKDPMEPTDRASFAAKMRSRIAAISAGTSGGAASAGGQQRNARPAAQQPPQTETFDEVPF